MPTLAFYEMPSTVTIRWISLLRLQRDESKSHSFESQIFLRLSGESSDMVSCPAGGILDGINCINKEAS